MMHWRDPYPNSGPAMAKGGSAGDVSDVPQRIRWNGRSMRQPSAERPARKKSCREVTASSSSGLLSAAAMSRTSASAPSASVANSGPTWRAVRPARTLCGPTPQATAEAQVALGIGYHAGLLSLAAMKSASEGEIIAHCEAVARYIPLVGFYLQPAVGGVVLSTHFWRRFAAIDNVIAIKVAPFNRYRTLDVLRAVAAADALDRIALYTGNDDHIVLDLTLPFDLRENGKSARAWFKGGLLGHWSVWTASAIRLFERCKEARHQDGIPADLLALDARVTDCNSAFFDVAHDFYGCIAGCHEVLQRQGLMQGAWCLDRNEGLSPGQLEEIDRVCRDHADLSDDAFVAANLQKWLA
jgi:hypothetical protein